VDQATVQFAASGASIASSFREFFPGSCVLRILGSLEPDALLKQALKHIQFDISLAPPKSYAILLGICCGFGTTFNLVILFIL
jgi:hypothetical protein